METKQHNDNDHLHKNMVGKSFLNGKERLDVKELQSDQYLVTRTKEHPFLKDKKSVKDENWEVEKFNQKVDDGSFKEIPTYTYTTSQKPYEINEINLRNKGLISLQRTDSGMMLTFDHQVSKNEVGLNNLSLISDTKTKEETQKEEPDLKPMLKQFHEFKGKHPENLLLFHVGESYQAYQQDAQKAAQVLGLPLTQNKNVKDMEGKPLNMIVFPEHEINTNLARLIRAGQRAAICDQLPDPKLTQNKQQTNNLEAAIKAQQSAGQKTAQTEAPKQQSSTDKHDNIKDNIAKIDKIIGNNYGLGIIPEKPIMATTATGIAFEINRVVRENDGSMLIKGNDNQGKERAVNILKANDKTVADILSHITNNPPKELVYPAEVKQQQSAGQKPAQQTTPAQAPTDLQSPTQNTDAKVSQQTTAQPSQNAVPKQSIIAEIANFIGDNKGLALTQEPRIVTKNSKAIEFEVDRVIKEYSGDIRIYGYDKMGKERSMPVERANMDTLSKILDNLAAGKTAVLNSIIPNDPRNQTAAGQKNAAPESLPLSPKQKELIAQITEIVGDKRGVGVSPTAPIMARTSNGAEFPVDMIAKDKQGDIRLMGTDFMGRERSVTLEKADVRTLEDVINHLMASNLKNVDHNRQKAEQERRSTMSTDELRADKTVDEIRSEQMDDAHNMQNELVDRMVQQKVDFFKVNIPVNVIDLRDFKERNTVITSVQLSEEFGEPSLALVDKKKNFHELAEIDASKQIDFIQAVTNTFNQLYGNSQTTQQSAQQTADQKATVPAAGPSQQQNEQAQNNPKANPSVAPSQQQNDQTANNVAPAHNIAEDLSSRQIRKLFANERVHDAAKKDNPDDLVFVRLREPESKKLMFQTFGDDAERLKGISPSVSIDLFQVKNKQHFVVSLQQEDAAAVRNDLMTHNVQPVIINAKGEKIENDRFLAFSQNDQQNASQQTAQTAESKASQQTTMPPTQNDQTTSQKADVPSVAPSQQQNEQTQASQPITSTPSNDQSAKVGGFPEDAILQYNIKRNSHNAAFFDIRLYVNGEKVGGHHLNDGDYDLWCNKKVPIEDLMVKYFGKELGVTKFPNLTYYKGDNEQQNADQTRQKTDASPEKIENYNARAKFHQEVSQKENESLVMLKMNTKDGNSFYQTFNKDADIAAEILGRKIIPVGDNRYVSLDEKEMTRLSGLYGAKIVFADFNPYLSQKQQTSQAEGLQQPNRDSEQKSQNWPEIKPNTRVEYVISPVMKYNKEKETEERIPGVYALAVTADGVSLGRKALTKDERDLLNQRPSEITNIINNKFAKELQGTTVSFKQVHRPKVADDVWNNRDMGDGKILDYAKVSRNEMTAKVNGVTLGPKTMFKQEVNDFFDHARPLTEIVAKVFRDELKTLNVDAGQQQNLPKITGSQALALWNKVHENNDSNKLAFVQREGRYGMYYTTFGEDAKNMSKVTNRSLKVIDTEEQKNVIYAGIPEDQIEAVFRQLRNRGFQPFAINTKGEPVSITPEQKNSTLKSVTLEDGRKVENISLKNAGDKWIMTANIDGKPMPQREVSEGDAKTFKQGQQNMAVILTKYFKNDLSQQQDSPKQGLGR